MMFSPKPKLNRSCSESDLHKVSFDNLSSQDHSFVSFDKKIPLVRKRVLFVEEIIHGSGGSPSGLLRSSSCDLVVERDTFPAHLHNLQSFFSTSLILNDTFNECDISNLSLNTQLNPNIPKVSTNYMKTDGVTPMEVDVLQNSLKRDDRVDFVETMDMDVDPDNFTSGEFNNLDSALKKRYARKRQAEMSYSQESQREYLAVTNNTTIVPVTLQKKPVRHNHFALIVLVCFVLILSYILFIWGDISISVNSDIQFQNIQKDLLEKVHKQKTSVSVIVQSLEQRERWASKIKVLGFIGTSGVGKTFIANVIKKHFPREVIHELYGIQLSYVSQWDKVLSGLKSCCLNLIIIDDLKRPDTTDVFALVHSLPQDQFILVISIFNVQYYDGKNHTINFNEITEIRNDFDNSSLYHELVVFKEFNADEVKDWVEKQFKFKKIDYSLQEKIMKNVLDGHIAKYHGLKGLNAKILLELGKNND